MENPKDSDALSFVRVNVILAACYFVYTGIAAAILFVDAAVGSQAAAGCMSVLLLFAIALISPLPMLVVGVRFLRNRRYAVLLAFGIAIAQLLATAVQLRSGAGNAFKALDTPRTILFYVCFAQTFYLPGSLFLAPLSSAVLLLQRFRRRRKPR